MKDTLCLECANACGGCSWSRKKAKPVKGWNAIRKDLVGGIESYIVVSCPEYVPDGKKHRSQPIQCVDSKNRIRRDWTEEETEMLYLLRKSGKTIRACAEELGRTRSSVSKKLERDRNGVY